MTRNVSEIFFDLQKLYDEFAEIAASGRITMSTDEWNEEHRDVLGAVTKAADAFQAAIDATRWMETLPPARTTEDRSIDG